MPRGGKRPGAGAPRGNLNALKHGRRSRQFAELGALIAASPAARDTLIKLAEREAARNLSADQTANYIISQVLRLGVLRAGDRLIVLPDTLDGRSINELVRSLTQNSGFSLPTINPHEGNPTVNQSPDSNGNAKEAENGGPLVSVKQRPHRLPRVDPPDRLPQHRRHR